MYGTMPTSEPKARYAAPHTAETGRISAASSTRSDFLWRSSSSSSGSAPKRASRAATLSIHEVPARVGERERVIAHGVDVVLGLPEAPALDARSRVERVDHAPPEDVPCDRRR